MITKVNDRCGTIVKDKVSNELLYINDLAAQYNIDRFVMTYTQLKWQIIKSIENRIKNDYTNQSQYPIRLLRTE